MIIGAAHPGITVTGVERSLRFYGGILGIEHTVSRVSDQPYLALVNGVPGCSLRIGFARIEGVDVPLEFIEEAFVGPPADITTGVNKRARAIYFAGLDNVPLELFQRPLAVAA